MRNKSIFKSVLAIVLVIASVFTLFGCNRDPEVIGDPLTNGQWANQVENKVWYYKQGYMDTWEIANEAVGSTPINVDTGLVLQLVPTANKTDVAYNVYCHEQAPLSMQDSEADIASYIFDENREEFFFNLNNYVDEPRAAFVLNSSEPVTITAKYSKLQLQEVEYRYTKDGEDWNGIYCSVFSKGSAYFVITFEAKASVFDQYKADYLDLVGDFRKAGWETSEK